MENLTKEESAWIEKLRKVLKSQPKTLLVYDNEHGLAIFKGNELPIDGTGGVDSRIEHESIYPNRGAWERGAW